MRKSSVLVSGNQEDLRAQQDYEKVAEAVSSGQLRGAIIQDEAAPSSDEAVQPAASRVRKGALWGARAGFVIGLVSLIASVIIGAGTGALIARATELRIEGGSPPRVRFVRSQP